MNCDTVCPFSFVANICDYDLVLPSDMTAPVNSCRVC